MARPYFVNNQRMRCVGPHELDQIRSWVSEGILPSDVEIREEGDTMWIEAKDLPGFYDFPDQLVQ